VPVQVHEYSDKYLNKQKCGGGPRDGKPTCIVLHSTEGPTAEGGAKTLTTRPDASAHIVVGDTETFRIVPSPKYACGVKDVNDWTLHIEQAGFAKWKKREWLTHIGTIRRAAFWTAVWMKQYGIPAHFLTTQDLNDGKRRGFTYHRFLSLSDVSSSTHWDPGYHYPMVTFMALLTYYRLRRKLFGGPKPQEAT
jgi:N-acetylmuramoyl-L-alanine amidase-like protein